MSDNVSLGLLDRKREQLEEAAAQLRSAGNGPGGDGNNPHINGMFERLSKLEGEFNGIKFAAGVAAAVFLGGIAFLGAQISRLDTKVESVNEQVSAIPDKINNHIRDLVGTLSQAITASKQNPPQVVLIPTPTAPASFLPPSPPAPQMPKSP